MSTHTRYSVLCTAIDDRPYWHQLDAYSDLQKAIHRANNFALDQGGYVYVKDETGKTVYGTDPAELDRAITNGTNRLFPLETARRMVAKARAAIAKAGGIVTGGTVTSGD